jgi:putative phosphonate metabolism protein
MMPRYALYYAPRPDEPLAVFGRGWLGRDVESGKVVTRIRVRDISPERLVAITAEVSRYGLHGTLKPPFRLAPGRTEPELLEAAAAFATRRRPVAFGALVIKSMAGFLALTADRAANPLGRLAAACVRDFDSFRGPSTEQELAFRRAVDLTARQEELLVAWGYPYVFDEFRFHLTLTTPLEENERTTVAAILDELTEEARRTPGGVKDLVVFLEPAPDAPFRAIARFPLTGS